MDILSAILGAFVAITVIDVFAIAVIGFLIYRFLSGLNPLQRTVVSLFFIVSGVILIITAIGAEVGVISIVAGLFATALGVIKPSEEEDG